MKYLLINLLAFIITSFAFAQNPDKALAKVSYSFIHIQDTTQKDKPYSEIMLLVIGKNASVYTSYDKITQNLARKKQMEEQMKNQSGNANVNINIKGNKSTSQLDYFYFAKEHKFYTRERVFNNYLVEESDIKIDWKITKDTSSFSGLHCQKAITHFKGRNWIAWYAPELPFQSGPWKLNSLPGLIIEAYDEKKEVQFQFAGMENMEEQTETKKPIESTAPKISASNGSFNVISLGNADSTVPYLGGEIKLPIEAIKATRKELDKLKEARDKDPQGFMKTQMAGNATNIVITGYASPRGSTTPKIVLNNPVELPEKK